MKRKLTKLIFGLKEGEPIDLTFKKIEQNTEPLRGAAAHKQVAEFNSFARNIKEQLKP